MKQRVFRHLGARAPLLLLMMLLGIVVAARRPAPVAHSRSGLAALLAEATGSWVDDSQFVWEPSRGALLDLLAGRGVFFLSSPSRGSPRDLLHARVRVAFSGRPLSARNIHNLTQTPLGDDTGLLGLGSHVVYATITYGLVQAVTVLNSQGARAADLSESWLERTVSSLTDYQQTGRASGFGRFEVVLSQPSAAVTIRLTRERLLLQPSDGQQLAIDLNTRKPLYQATPKAVAGERWVRSPGGQPDPSWLPGIFETMVQLGTLQVRLYSFDRGRFVWRLRAGSREPTMAGHRPPKLQLDAPEQARVLVALNLGHATVGTDFGMAFAGSASLPLRTDRATLVISEPGTLRLVPPAATLQLAPTDSAVQLPLLIKDGKVSPNVTSRGSRLPRGGLCLLATGRVLVALAENDSSDVLALALAQQGCQDAVELDRGSHHAAFTHRAGTDQTPRASYETSVLFALDQPMQPHTFRSSAAQD